MEREPLNVLKLSLMDLVFLYSVKNVIFALLLIEQHLNALSRSAGNTDDIEMK